MEERSSLSHRVVISGHLCVGHVQIYPWELTRVPVPLGLVFLNTVWIKVTCA
jgi:hypothetical protein